MSRKIFNFVESNLPSENFSKLPLIPIIIKIDENNQDIIFGLIDSGSTISFIDVDIAKNINGIIIDNAHTTGISAIIENRPVIEIIISNESMDGNWLNLKVAVIDSHHPNISLILGRDFMIYFKQIVFDMENKKTNLEY